MTWYRIFKITCQSIVIIDLLCSAFWSRSVSSIDAWVEKASKFDIDSYDKIIFSYHGIPNSHVDNVYQDSICMIMIVRVL